MEGTGPPGELSRHLSSATPPATGHVDEHAASRVQADAGSHVAAPGGGGSPVRSMDRAQGRTACGSWVGNGADPGAARTEGKNPGDGGLQEPA